MSAERTDQPSPLQPIIDLWAEMTQGDPRFEVAIALWPSTVHNAAEIRFTDNGITAMRFIGEAEAALSETVGFAHHLVRAVQEDVLAVTAGEHEYDTPERKKSRYKR